MKTCSRCHIEKDESEFYRTVKYTCKACHNLHKKKDPERNKSNDRRHYWKKKYGITEDQYNEMNKTQNGLCKACNHPQSNGKFLSVDHCHSTGRVRGLLCSNCNLAVGNLLESVDRALMVAKYIKETVNSNS